MAPAGRPWASRSAFIHRPAKIQARAHPAGRNRRGVTELARHAERQEGLLALRDSPRAQSTFSRRVMTGEWQRPQRANYAPIGSLETPRRAMLAAQLAVGGDVLLTGAAACWLHGLIPHPPEIIDLVVSNARNVADPRGARV